MPRAVKPAQTSPPARPAQPSPSTCPAAHSQHPRIATLKATLANNPSHRARPGGPFSDLTYSQQQAAQAWLWKFTQRWAGNLPQWRLGILIGTARRLALRPPPANFGKALHGAWGGHESVRKCRAIGLLSARIVAMVAAREWKRKERPALPTRQLPL